MQQDRSILGGLVAFYHDEIQHLLNKKVSHDNLAIFLR